MNSPLQQNGEITSAPAIAAYTPLKLFLAVSQQRGGKGAGDRLLAFAGEGGVADRDDALPGPRQLAKPRRIAATRLVIEPVADRRRLEYTCIVRRARDARVAA